MGNTGAKLRLNGEVWSVVICLFADDTMLLAESERDLQRVVNEFYSICKRRKFNPLNTGTHIQCPCSGREIYGDEYSKTSL